MSGIVFLLVLAIWFYIVKKLSGLFTSNMQPGNKKIIVYTALFILFFIAPVADEIVGGFQFRALCKQGTKLIYDAEEIRGKKLLWVREPSTKLKNTILPIYESSRALVDLNTGKHLIEFTEYDATGGWLSRFLAFNSITKPYVFNGGCGAKDEVAQLRNELNIETTFER